MAKRYRRCHCGAHCDKRDETCAGQVLGRHESVTIVDGKRAIKWAHECDTHATEVQPCP